MRNCFRKCLFFLKCIIYSAVSLLAIAWPCSAEVSLNLNGSLDAYHSIQIEAPNSFLNSKIRSRLELKLAGGDTGGLISGELIQNNNVSNEYGFGLREAFLDYRMGNWDFRIGRQIISWGKSDAVPVTDLVCPTDFSDYFIEDPGETKKPVDAMKIRLLGNSAMTELILIPFFEPAVYPSGNSPWAPQIGWPGEIRYLTPLIPDKNIKNGEYFAKVSLYRPKIDFAISVFSTWCDTPVYHQTIDGSTLNLQEEYFRISGIGGEFSATTGNLVFRGETAYFSGRLFEPESPGPFIEKEMVSLLMGMDWYPGNSWTISLQCADEIITGYDETTKRGQHNYLATLNISKKLFRDSLTLSGFIYSEIREADYFARLSADYALTDELRFTAGLLNFGGNTSGTLGQYWKNNAVFAKFKYSF